MYSKREHVIPQGFGRFTTNNLVLKNIVCDDCNKYFGEKIELFLCRDSYEGFERIRHGIEPKKPLKNRKRIKNKIASGQFKGLIVREKSLADNGSIDLEKALQAGFFNLKTEEYDYFEPCNIPKAEELKTKGYDLKSKEIIIIAGDGPEYDFMVQHLQSLGIDLKPEERNTKIQEDQGQIEIESNITLDRTIMRGICKIAFNYFAFIAGKSFVLNKSFDPIRDFILFGEGKGDDYLSFNLPPILHDDQKLEKLGAKVTEGHLITIGWLSNRVVGKLSLFNSVTYGIKFCSSFSGVWIPLNAGHHFETKTKKVTKLMSFPKNMLLY